MQQGASEKSMAVVVSDYDDDDDDNEQREGTRHPKNRASHVLLIDDANMMQFRLRLPLSSHFPSKTHLQRV